MSAQCGHIMRPSA